MFDSMMKKMFGTKQDRDIKELEPTLRAVNALEPKYKAMSDSELQNQTSILRDMLQNKGATVNDILPDAFAVVREASSRVLKMRHFDVQILGGIVLHQGKIAEMKTGEGKTLTATLALYLNACYSERLSRGPRFSRNGSALSMAGAHCRLYSHEYGR